MSVPGYDLGLDSWPSTPGHAGYVELWYYPHDADDTQPVFQILGTSALPLVDIPHEKPPLPPEPAPMLDVQWT